MKTSSKIIIEIRCSALRLFWFKILIPRFPFGILIAIMFYFCHHFSLLYVETADRPGLLLEMIKIMSDVNINVESAEIDTEVIFSYFYFILSKTLDVTYSHHQKHQYKLLKITFQGLVAKDKFHVSYRGAALNSSLSQVIECYLAT